MTVTLTDYASKRTLVAAGNNELWSEDAAVAGKLVEVAAANGQLDTTDKLTLFEAFEKSVILNGANKKIYDPRATAVKLATANIGTNPPDFQTELTGGISGAKMVVDYATSLSGACTIYGKRTTTATFASGETVTGLDDDANAISFATSAAETAGPQFYSFTPFGNSASFGALPAKLYLGCMHLGRLYAAGDPDHPTQWFASRQGNIFDWLYDQEDAQSACTGSDVEMGEIQDVIRALIPYNNDYLLFGCQGTIYALMGDPMQGGTLKRVSDKVGVFGAQSWCFDEKGNLYFWGSGGIYRLGPGLSGVENLTQFSLPNLVHDEAVDPSTHRIMLAFDTKRHGILVTVTTIATRVNSCYWFDPQAGAFFPESYPTACAPYSMVYYDSQTPGNRDLLLGCSDGFVRRFDETLKDDNIGASTAAIDSYVTFGPFPLSEHVGDEGVIQSVQGVLGGTGCSDVTYYVYVGDSPEAVMDKVTAGTYDASDTLYAPGFRRGNRSRRSVRGQWGAIRLRNNTAGQTWGFEEIEIEIATAKGTF